MIKKTEQSLDKWMFFMKKSRFHCNVYAKSGLRQRTLSRLKIMPFSMQAIRLDGNLSEIFAIEGRHYKWLLNIKMQTVKYKH